MAEEEKKKLTEQELIAQAQVLESEKRQKFVDEYNALCEKHGYVVQPKVVLDITKK